MFRPGFALATVSLSGAALGAPGDLDAEGLAADAATRTSLLAPDHPALVQNGPGVEFGGQFQFRYTVNVRDEEGEEEAVTQGFSASRAKLFVDSDLNETWGVHLQGAFDSDGGAFSLEDAWTDWQLDESLTFRFGQFKVPTLAEELMSSGRLQAIDRSVTNEVFNLDRTQGFMFIYDTDRIRFLGSFNMGAASANTDFNGANNADYAFTGRFEYVFAGDKEQLEDFSGWQGQELAYKAGFAMHAQDGGESGINNTGATANVNAFQTTGDFQIEGNGWNAFGAIVWNHVEPPGNIHVDNFGVVVQGGVFANPSNEFIARFDVVMPDSVIIGGDDDFSTITVGWNHYFIPESHASKFQVDLQWFLNATTENGLVNPEPEIGLLDSSNDSQFAIRAQYSATF
jgi:hypothetical protein